MKNRIYLFEWSRSRFMSWVILLATGCPYAHAAVEVGGVLYDASESRGTFDRADRSRFIGRPCLVVEVDGDLSDWLREMDGKQYDYTGVGGWLLCRFWRRGCGDTNKFYCFEAANAALKHLGRKHCTGAVSGCDLLGVLPGAPRYKRFGG